MENPNNYYHLPEDILIEIFSWLPPKQVGRFRCLSKSWRQNLSTTQFVKSHLSHKTNKTDSILLLGFNSPRTIQTLSTPLDENDTVVPRNLDFPDVLVSEPTVFGSCNGLVLLVGKKDEIFVVNPLTLEHASIVNIPLSVVTSSAQVQYGFGYDSCSGDYKIVKLSISNIGKDEIAGPFVDVYSMKKGSWKPLNNFTLTNVLRCVSFGRGNFVNGVIHWLACVKDAGYVIAAFDVATESFHAIPLPKDEMAKECAKYYKLFGIQGHLFLVWALDDFEVWIMKEYGQVNSWTECSTIHVSGQLPSGTMLLCVIGEDEILLSSFYSTNLFVWNLRERTIKTVIANGTRNSFLAGCAFVDSLASPI